ncbi:MAG: glutamine--fructose-6-phosphate transaminase (isomerizing) [Clostridia bacterium]|nr:glutamine--fructose-6-phosphate transaminase (isomerizing) [Clostridia bacterium]
MCGMFAYVGHGNAVPVLLEGLKRLEYRGCDSAGIAFINNDQLVVVKKEGRVAVLEKELGEELFQGSSIGIGHTRWATHGKPCDRNSHPHLDCTGKFAIVHNGIIENYLQLKSMLIEKGHRFVSDTDTEVFAHLLEDLYNGDLFEAVREAEKMIKGSYAIACLSEHEPNRLVAVRKNSPLIVGLGEGEYFFASDISAVLSYTRKVQIVNNGETVILDEKGPRIFNVSGPVEREIMHIEWDTEVADKGDYDHFMLKEIFEQPRVLGDSIKSRVDQVNKLVDINEINIDEKTLEDCDRIYITACGTAYHAGLVGKYAIEKLVRVPVEVEVASEFRYRDPMITERSLVIVLSQSGETADTLAALRLAKEKGARVLAITNTVGSTVTREADDVMYTWAGPETAVASTKGYVTQLSVMYLLAGYFAQLLGTVPKEEISALVDALLEVPAKVEKILEQAEEIKEIAEAIVNSNSCFYIGRGLDYPVSMEGALKLKEVSYIHAESYAAGELKHGPLALIEKDTPVIALATQEHVYEKTVSNVEEVIARGGFTIAVTFEGDKNLGEIVDRNIQIPKTLPLISPILSVIPLQLLAYYVAVKRGNDVDKPRTLTKSVTVE